ncbi:uncharacterized protein LOC122044296 [Zingiber officinale]|uniref:uncharacterized protein LOC122044296 n=1 Tax=Zingiber officinale TaxID=94328 RepID=UPI001C4B5539|nr:uncharacterized protein LOC122044296 [Zingiber officinale]
MQIPQTLKETQKLVGRITALSRFISKSADRAAPFFKVLRKAAKFQWTEECTQAFEELKQYLESLPSLFKPVVGEPLWVYLSATPEAVGAVLVKEQDNTTGQFGVNSKRMQVYKEAYEKMKGEFKEITVTKIPRTENERADELAKMASSLGTWTLDQSIAQTFLVAQVDLQNNAGEVIDWRAPIMSFLQRGAIPTSPEEARMIRRQAHSYAMIGDQLYKRSFSRPLLKYLNMEEADQALREIHSGCCGNHARGRTLARKVLLAGYFWPTLQKDAQRLVNTCLSCQNYQNLTHRPTELLRTSTVSCPFDQWGMDSVGHFPMAIGQRRFLLVAVDYFSKWVEAEALARITEDATEVVNREIVRGLKVKLDHVGGSWVDELPGILWAYRTTPRESTGLTPFNLVYGNEAVVPLEVGIPSVRRMMYDGENTERRLAELDFISEIREQAAARLEAYRQRMRQNYNRKVIPRFSEKVIWSGSR